MHVVSSCDRWLQLLKRRVDMTAILWRHRQTDWFVRSAFMWPALHTKWPAVGQSIAKPAWMNTRNAPALAQIAGKEDSTSLTPEMSELQPWNNIPLNVTSCCMFFLFFFLSPEVAKWTSDGNTCCITLLYFFPNSWAGNQVTEGQMQQPWE